MPDVGVEIPESQNCRDWKGLQEVIGTNPPAKAGSLQQAAQVGIQIEGNSRIQESWEEVFEAKTEGKKAFSISTFSASPITWTPPSFSRGLTLSLVFLLLFTYFKKNLCIILSLFCKLRL